MLCLVTAVFLVTPMVPAFADHTNPSEPLSPTDDPGTTQLQEFGEGDWTIVRNFPANPGTDHKLFWKKGRLFAAVGTLGQADEASVGQRVIRLINLKGKVAPKWMADHGSANCPTEDPSATTGLQHDVSVTPKRDPRLMIDTTDASARCHDEGGGGLEIVNIGRVHQAQGKRGFKPREIHLTRHVGTSHTATVDATRPWIVYNNTSQSTGAPWVDVLNIKSCLNKKWTRLKAKRENCRPKVYRIKFKPEWAQRIDTSGERVEGTESACHDITATPGKIYCANLNSSIVLNVKNLTNDKGEIRGTPLKCKLVDGTNTGAKVTDCSDTGSVGNGEAKGWTYIGHVNHPGRTSGPHNTNTEVPSKEGVAVAHEAEPTPNGKWMFVTDERGGGIVPIGASCVNNVENTYGNGGVHVFKIANDGKITYAQDPEGNPAVFIGKAEIPSPTFCTAHVMEQIAGEQRFSIAWYTQGTKIVDYFIDSNGRWTFRETASVIPQGPNADTWSSTVFKKQKNKDGTVTYWFLATDVTRGIDILKWTGPANPMGSPPPAGDTKQQRSGTQDGVPGALLGLGLIPAALKLRRRRRTVA